MLGGSNGEVEGAGGSGIAQDQRHPYVTIATSLHLRHYVPSCFVSVPSWLACVKNRSCTILASPPAFTQIRATLDTMSTQQQLKDLANLTIPAFLLSTGLLGLLSPTTLAAGFGMPIDSPSHAEGFVQCMGGRNLTFGLIAAIFLQRGDRKAVGTMAGLLAVDGAIDGWVCYKYAGLVAASPHWVAAAGIPFVASWMGS